MKSESQRFQRVVGPCFSALYRAAWRLTRDRRDAEDLVQEVCLRAFGALAELEKLDRPVAWLLRVQYRVFVDETRRRRRAPFAPLPDSAMSPADCACDAPGPEHMADSLHLRRRLEQAWQKLDREQRALLALHAEGYGPAELEAILGISRNAVSARLHRARSRLAGLLEDDPDVQHLQLTRVSNQL